MSNSFQDDYSVNKPDIIPSSPQSKIFERYLDHPVTEYNGLPKIEISLHEIDLAGMKIPVTLSYHAGGIKYKQFAGDVGTGWSLNIGGYRVSRDVKGKPDERYNLSEKTEFNDAVRKGLSDEYLASITYDSSSSTGRDVVKGRFIYQDGEYDIFSYMLPSTRGHFIISNRNSYNENIQIFEENQDNVTIGYEIIEGKSDISNLEIIDNKGYKYYFGKDPNIKCTHYESCLIERPIGIEMPATGWPLRKMISPNNKTVDFKYKYQRFDTNNDLSPILRVMDAEYGGATFCWQPLEPSSPTPNELMNCFSRSTANLVNKKEYTYTYYSQFVLNEIATDNIIIQITRCSNNNQSIDKIEIKDLEGNVIKAIKFEFVDINKEFLKSIQIGVTNEMEKQYQFEYYPIVGSGQDQWGFYSQSRPNHSYTDLSLHNDHKTDWILEWATKTHINPCHQKTLCQLSFYNSTLENAIKEYPFSEYAKFGWNDRCKNDDISSYSLKKIIYPTGGTTEYFYEPHQIYGIKGGGQRIKEIKTKASEESEPEIITYKYGKDETGNGFPSILFDYKNFSNETFNYTYTNEATGQYFVNSNIGFTSRTYSTKPLTLSKEISEFQVSYKDVNIYKYNGNKYNGKMYFSYELPASYEQNKEYSNFYLTSEGHNFFRENSGNRALHDITGYKIGTKPIILSKIIYDNNDNIMLEETYEYIKSKKDGLYFNNLFSTQVVFLNTYENPELKYSLSNSLFDYNEYKLYMGINLLSTKEIKRYDDKGDLILTKENFIYNDKNQLVSRIEINNTVGNIERTFTYPNDYPYGTETEIIEKNIIFTEMVNCNIVSPIIETVTFNDGIEIGRIRTNYKQTTDNIIVPSSVESSASGVEDMRTDITYDFYDKKGNILQYTTLDGVKTSYLWGYNYNYPIAEIRNASYSEVQSSLSVNPDILAQSMNPDMSKIDSLRTQLAEASVSTFKYKPFIGLISSKNPAGLSTYYEYDEFNRLIGIKDHNKNYTDFYKYNYANQPIQMYEKLEISLMDVNDSYEMMESASFSAAVKGGSGNYLYSWYLLDDDNNKTIIDSITNSSNNTVNFVLSCRGNTSIHCTVIDLESEIKKASSRRFIVYSFLELKLSTNTQYSKYVMSDTEIFTITPARGSGNYRYNWYLRDSIGNNLFSQLNSTSNRFNVNFSQTQTGKLTLYCLVKDITTMKENDISKTFEVDWFELDMPVKTHYSISQNPSFYTFKISVRGGSGNFIYDWYLTDENDQLKSSIKNSTSNSFNVDFKSLGNMKLKCKVRDIDTGKSSEKQSTFIVQKLISFINLEESYNDYGSYKVSTVTGFINNPYMAENIKLYLNFVGPSYRDGTRVEFRVGEQIFIIDFNSIQKRKYVDLSLPAGNTPIQMTLFKYMDSAFSSMELIPLDENPFTAVSHIGIIEIN